LLDEIQISDSKLFRLIYETLILIFIKMKLEYGLIASIIFLITFSSTSISQSFADTDDNIWVANLIELDPYYFSDFGFGPGILKITERSLEPYLVPGQTNEESSLEEISAAYEKSTANISENRIPSDDDRGKIFVVKFSGGYIENQEYTSFIGFTPIKYQISNKAPAHHQQYHQAVELQSLPEKGMQKFYESIVAKAINPGIPQRPFDISIELLTGDGHILQSWYYKKCELVEYTPYTNEILAELKFSGKFAGSFEDKSLFACVGHNVDFSLRESELVGEKIRHRDLLPDDNDTVKKFAVRFSGGEIPFSGDTLSFSKFTPVIGDTTSEPQIAHLVYNTPQFLLSSLPSKQNESFYNWIGRYINAGKPPESFDVTIDLITGDNSILQTWSYTKCDVIDYVTYFEDLFPVAKFSGGFAPEFRDKSIFQCRGLMIDPTIRAIEDDSNLITSEDIPSEQDRAQSLRVYFEGTEIEPPKTIDTFTKFAPVIDDKPQFVYSTYPYERSPKFILESLPSKDKEWFGQSFSKFNPPPSKVVLSLISD